MSLGISHCCTREEKNKTVLYWWKANNSRKAFRYIAQTGRANFSSGFQGRAAGIWLCGTILQQRRGLSWVINQTLSDMLNRSVNLTLQSGYKKHSYNNNGCTTQCSHLRGKQHDLIHLQIPCIRLHAYSFPHLIMGRCVRVSAE